MTEEEARAYISKLTYEEKLQLNELLKKLEAARERNEAKKEAEA